MAKLPWCDCQVAFPVADDDLIRSHWDSIDNQLPEGWMFLDNKRNGDRYVAVFRVSKELTVADGEQVQKLLRKVSRRKRGKS